MNEETVKKVAKGAGIAFIGTGIGMGFAYLCALAVARYLGPTDYGLISLASAITTIVSTIILIGIHQGVLRYVSFYKGKKDENRIKGVIVSALEILLPLGIISAIVLFLFSDIISVSIFDDPNLTPILKIFSISIPFSVLFFVFNNAVYGFQEVKYAVYSNQIFQNSCRLFLLVILLLLGLGVYGAAFAYTFAIIATAFAAFYYLNKIFPAFSRKIKAIPMKRELFSFSWPLMFAGTLALVMSWIDTLMIGYFLTSYNVGIYRASLTTASLLLIVPSSFISIFYPVITELFSQTKMTELKEINTTVTKWILLFVFPLGLLMILFSKQILYILYGTEYMAGGVSLVILSFTYLIISVFRPTSHIIWAVGRTKLVMVNTLVGATIDVALNLWLIPIYGINGAAIATAISIAIVDMLAFVEVYGIIRSHPFRLNQIKIILSSFISLFVIYSVVKIFLEEISIYALISMLLLYACIYFGLVLITRTFEKDDITVMEAIEEKVGVKSDMLRKIIGRFL